MRVNYPDWSIEDLNREVQKHQARLADRSVTVLHKEFSQDIITEVSVEIEKRAKKLDNITPCSIH